MEEQSILERARRIIEMEDPEWMTILEEIIRRKMESININDAKVLK